MYCNDVISETTVMTLQVCNARSVHMYTCMRMQQSYAFPGGIHLGIPGSRDPGSPGGIVLVVPILAYTGNMAYQGWIIELLLSTLV